MRIACPACNAAYQVPDDQIREGRVVRCARCGTDWAPVVAIPADDGETDRERVAPPPVEERDTVIESREMAVEDYIPLPRPMVLPKAPPKPRGSVLLVFAWALSVALIAAAVAGLYFRRERVMQVWAPSIRAYTTLGLANAPAVTTEAPAVSERRE